MLNLTYVINLEFLSLWQYFQSCVYYTSADKQFRKCFDFVWFLGGVCMFTSLLQGSCTPTTSHSPKTLFIRLTGDSKISHCPFSLLITFAFKTKSINKVFLIYLKTFQITYSAILRFSLCLPMQLHCVSTYRYNMYTFTAWFYFGVYEWGSTLMRSCPRNCLNVCLYTHLL